MQGSQEDVAKIHRLQENLETIRKIAGWTTQRLADEIGVSRQTISNIENDRSPMTKTQYLAIRTVLNFEIVERSNDKLAEALSKLVDEPSEAEETEESGHEANISKTGRVKPSDYSTSTMKGLSLLTTAMLAASGFAAASVAVSAAKNAPLLAKLARMSGFINTHTK